MEPYNHKGCIQEQEDLLMSFPPNCLPGQLPCPNNYDSKGCRLPGYCVDQCGDNSGSCDRSEYTEKGCKNYKEPECNDNQYLCKGHKDDRVSCEKSHGPKYHHNFAFRQ